VASNIISPTGYPRRFELRYVTNKMHAFQINILFNFLVSSTCFEHLMLIIRKTILYMQVLYGMFFMRLCKQSSRWTDVLDLDLHRHRRKNLK